MGEKSSETANPSRQVLEQAKALFEPQLQALGLSEGQIQSFDLEELETALSTINDSMRSPESFGVLKFAIRGQSIIGTGFCLNTLIAA